MIADQLLIHSLANSVPYAHFDYVQKNLRIIVTMRRIVARICR